MTCTRICKRHKRVALQVMKILTFTTLYPSSVQPTHGIFVEQRLRHLIAGGEIRIKVVAPVPWFPFKHERFKHYSKFAQVPFYEQRHDIEVIHPRFLVIPKVGMTLAPILLSLAMLRVLRNIIKDGYDFDLIDAHYLYPDGVAAVLLGQYLRKPVIVTARGSDVNIIPQFTLPRMMILWATRNAARIVTVCKALQEKLVDMGASDGKIVVLRNGIDLNLFKPLDRKETRAKLGLSGKTLLSVGNLIELKGHDITIQALVDLPDVRLLIVGEGKEESNLKKLARSLGVADRVIFLGRIEHEELKRYYNAVDALVLASSREGWANVLLESMACGTPVIATRVSGTPEVVTSPQAGILMKTRTPEGLVAAYYELFSTYPEHGAVRRYAEGYGWQETSQGQRALFKQVLTRHT